MTNIFDELVEKQRAAEQAHHRVEELRGMYGPPTEEGGWSSRQTTTYNTAWRAWRDLARDVRTAVADYAKAQGEQRSAVETQVKKAVLQKETGDVDA
ncbi:hypothetical protein [Streptomyces sp. NBC_00443]|uniref:hypothetical protein n=1 Tax=Streptomyces sp. NBC_00443 TaxID=2975743 RepID=UPI002E237B64